MLENCFHLLSYSKRSYMKWCSFSYECHKTSSQDHPIGLEKFCLQEHNPFWYPVSEVEIELSQTKYIAKQMAGRMRDNVFSLIYVSAYWRNVENNSNPKQTKALWHSLGRLHGTGRHDFFTAVCIHHPWNIKWKKGTCKFLQKIHVLGQKFPRSIFFGTDSLVRQKKKKGSIYSEFIIHWEKLPTITIMFLLTRHIID